MLTPDTPHARVLVVDDEVPICRIITRILESQGFAAGSVSDRDKVRALVTAQEFDFILLDRSLANAKSDGLLEDLRKLAPNAKILFFTGDYVNAGEAALVDGVIQKPVNGKSLAEALKRLL